jgi:uncharacterized coiled-coil DUF342 family protein
MTEEIINSDGSRNWEANILLDNIKRLKQERDDIQDRLSTLADTYQETRNVCKRLEQENKELQAYKDINEDFKKAWGELNEKYKQLRSALEEIQKVIKSYDLTVDNGASVDTLYTIRKIINEVLE